jgi:hypothetical protein
MEMSDYTKFTGGSKMISKYLKLIAVIMSCFTGFACASLTDEQCYQIKQAQAANADRLAQVSMTSSNTIDLHFAFGALWLNRQLPEANRRLRAAYQTFLDNAHSSTMTPEVAQTVKWQMRTWLRIYYLFCDTSSFYPNRLEHSTQNLLEELFWNYGVNKSKIRRADTKYIWVIQGSENHDMMDLGNAFLALQAVKNLPKYRDRKLPDGFTAQQHYHAWNTYYKLYCEQRAKYGLYVEVFSPTYGKYFIPELTNIFDFAEDPVLRHKMDMLLQLTWADWAVGQLDGIRGGGRTRVKGDYEWRGTTDSWYLMSRILLNQGAWFDLPPAAPIIGYPYVLATSRFRLNDVVIDLALSTPERGNFTYISRRPGKMTYSPDRPPLEDGCWYDMDAKDPRFVRYDNCTPDYVMGCFFVDPTLGTCFRVDQYSDKESPCSYAAISSQNRQQGIIFGTDSDARVYPMCLAKMDADHKRINYNQHLAVQHKNVMIVQKNHKIEGSGDLAMRIFFYKGLKPQLIEREGWFLTRQAGAYLAVKAFSRKEGSAACGSSWDDDTWLRLDDDYAPVVFVAGRTSDFDSLDKFTAYVLSHQAKVKGNVLTYCFTDPDNQPTILTMPLSADPPLPTINGVPIDLHPKMVFDCPYIQSTAGSGLVTIRKGDRKLILDFNN